MPALDKLLPWSAEPDDGGHNHEPAVRRNVAACKRGNAGGCLTDRKSAETMLGKSVEWKSPGKTPTSIKGKITRVHGAKGKVVAQFEKGLPGQSFGTSIAVG